jgi:glycerol-3-phosphate dehydrogenase
LADNGPYDLLIVGGGVNGAGIARDAAGRGLKVLLCEQDDLAGATSSASTKLIHGGLRYLEHYEFRLVREALIEREVLLKAAPHIIRPMTFVLPHSAELRPAWMLRLGLFLYDHLGGRERLPGSRAIDLRRDPAGQPLAGSFTKAFCYSDCWVDDARLVVLNVLDAAERGADIRVRTRFAGARRQDGLWRATLAPSGGGEAYLVQARALINAAGPWVTAVSDAVAGVRHRSALRLVKGSHLVVPRLFEGEHAYILQHSDRRVIFVIPYEQDFSLIGTTEVSFDGNPATARMTEAESAYLCEAVNRYLAKAVRPENAVWTYSGVRPLYEDASKTASAVTRDYVFDIDAEESQAPILSIFGGKITTYRKLAEHALERLQPLLGFPQHAWTGRSVLPGGDLPGADFEQFLAEFTAARPWLSAALAQRYARAYGTRVERFVGGADLGALGEHLGDGVYEAEVDYLIRDEWARSAEDILWRRSKLGLHISDETRDRLSGWLERQPATAGSPVAVS